MRGTVIEHAIYDKPVTHSTRVILNLVINQAVPIYFTDHPLSIAGEFESFAVATSASPASTAPLAFAKT